MEVLEGKALSSVSLLSSKGSAEEAVKDALSPLADAMECACGRDR
jgi:hypothetical protein